MHMIRHYHKLVNLNYREASMEIKDGLEDYLAERSSLNGGTTRLAKLYEGIPLYRSERGSSLLFLQNEMINERSSVIMGKSAPMKGVLL